MFALGLGHKLGRHQKRPAGGVAWSATSKSASVALSSGNTVATVTVGGSVYKSVLGATGSNSGTVTRTQTVTIAGAAGFYVGAANTLPADGTPLGNAVGSIGIRASDGAVIKNTGAGGAGVGTAGPVIPTGAAVVIELNHTANTMRYRVNGGAFSGTYDLTGLTLPLYPAMSAADTNSASAIS